MYKQQYTCLLQGGGGQRKVIETGADCSYNGAKGQCPPMQIFALFVPPGNFPIWPPPPGYLSILPPHPIASCPFPHPEHVS